MKFRFLDRDGTTGIIHCMLRNVVVLGKLLDTATGYVDRATGTFIRSIEQRINGSFVRDTRSFRFERPDLLEPLQIASLLEKNKVIHSLRKVSRPTDEPRLFQWAATCLDVHSNSVSGVSNIDDAHALYPALAEGLERYLWWEADDYFIKPLRDTARSLREKHISHIPPLSFAAFTTELRARDKKLNVTDDSVFFWIRGLALNTNTYKYVPAQCVSGKNSIRNTDLTREPLIRSAITTGLATWPTAIGARLRGMLEVVERDAYMIMWLNKLTLPRISLASARLQNKSLDKLLKDCERYGLIVHAIRLITDAPTYAICVVVEDSTDHPPRWAIGLKAHHSLSHAIQEALVEALRARVGTRQYFEKNSWESAKPLSSIGHRDRLYYWGAKENESKLTFVVEGPVREESPEPWESDTDEEHFIRLKKWCEKENFELVSISLGTSKRNPTKWHVEMIIMPELLPIYMQESLPHTGGSRRISVPKRFGYTPLEVPFAEPHPFS